MQDRALPQDADLLDSIKISAVTEGINVTDAAMEVLIGLDPVLTIHEYPTTGGLTLELPHQVYVNATFDEPYNDVSTLRLDSTRDGWLVLQHPEGEVVVERLLTLPGYLDAVDNAGRRVTDVVMSHADRARLSPIAGCAYDCGYCDLPSMAYELRPTEQLLSALAVAQADHRLPVRHVLISGGSPRKRHYDEFEAMCRAVVEAASMPVDLMMSPMVGNLEFLDRMVAAGLQDLSINIEVFAPVPALEALRMKYKVTRSAFEQFIARAVELVGAGPRVRSLIIPGLESVEETLAGVEWLASLGCTPVLSPFRPGRGTPMEGQAPADPATMRVILYESRAIVADHGLGLGPDCIPCQHNTLTLPWDLRTA